jgi:coenzyme F420-0:L-glutamate ligase/coenzyme F420-1:gamma-L-glutamate ligase
VTGRVSLTAIAGLPEIEPGCDLPRTIAAALASSGSRLERGDILVIAQKIISKAENRYRLLDEAKPGAESRRLAALTGKDPRFVQLVLDESSAVVRAARDVLIVRHRLGLVMANAGIDRSNVPKRPDGREQVLLLPLDPDASARAIRQALLAGTGSGCGDLLGVVISDSFGRPWRLGVTNVAIGVAGLPALVDRRGEADREGRLLEMTEVAFADAVAAAAALAMGEAAEGTPMVLVRGLTWQASTQTAAQLLRPLAQDLFA